MSLNIEMVSSIVSLVTFAMYPTFVKIRGNHGYAPSCWESRENCQTRDERERHCGEKPEIAENEIANALSATLNDREILLGK